MKAAGAVYQGEGFTAIGLYNSYADVYSALPESLTGTHIIHTEYDFRDKQNHGATHSIDTYLIKDNSSVDNIIAITKAKGIRLKNSFYRSLSPVEQETLLKKYNIKSIVLKDLKDTQRLFALQSDIVEDVDDFAESPPLINRPSFVTFVPEIIPETKINYVIPKKSGQYLQPGKSDFIPSCVFGGNQDFVKPKSACIVSFIPMSKDAHFDSNRGVFVGYYDLKTGDCRYCYAGHHHLNGAVKDVFTIVPEMQQKEMREGTFKDFQKNIYGKRVKVLRLGKRTETGAKIFRPQLLTTIDSCIEVGTDLVMPTKLLEYDPNVVKGLLEMKKHDLDGSLLFSMSNRDNLERGALAYGRSNEARLETAIEYGMAGVNSNIYMMMEVVYNPMPEHLDTINRALKAGLGVQILGARVTRKDVAGAMTGRTWKELQGKLRMSTSSKNMYGEIEPPKMIGGYTMTPNTELHPDTVHPEIRKLIGDNNGRIRMCNHNSCETFCGKCYVGKGNIHKTVLMKREKARTSSSRTKKKDKTQGKLGLEFED